MAVTGFDWYGNLPQGVECRLHDRADGPHSLSLFLHRLPHCTDTIIDLSADPVISMALNAHGNVEREIDGHIERAAIEKDNLTLTPALAECRWRWSGEPLDILDVFVPIKLMRKIAGEYLGNDIADLNLQPRLALNEKSISFLIYSMLHSNSLAGKHANFLRETMAVHLVSCLLSLERHVLSYEHRSKSTLTAPALKRVQAYVDANLSIDISLQDMADVVGVSRFHFIRLFRNSVGLTPYAFVTERRMALAARLLAADFKLSVGEVAATCGFDDPSHFAACFRRTYGVAPRDYRRSCS